MKTALIFKLFLSVFWSHQKKLPIALLWRWYFYETTYKYKTRIILTSSIHHGQKELALSPEQPEFLARVRKVATLRLATPIFDHAHPRKFLSTFNYYQLVSTCKNSGYFIDLFWRYGWLKNPTIWLAENILAHISGTKNCPNMEFV